MTSPAPLYFDCDTGIDDSMALAYLVGASAVRLVGIGTVSGNTSAAQAARNTLALLALAGRDDVPVAVGAHDHLRTPFDGGVPHIHGYNGIGDIDIPDAAAPVADESAAELLIRLSHEHPGALRIIAVGPLSNLALALADDPTLPERVESVVLMGGAALVPGNLTPVAEANIGNDPEAAQAVVAAGWPVVLVPLDVTMENTLDEADRARLTASQDPLARAVGEMLDLYFAFHEPTFGARTCALHDPLAAAIGAGGIRAVRAPAVPVEVDVTDGPGRGQTVCDLRGQRLGPVDHEGATVRVVLATDRPLGPHLLDTLDPTGGRPRAEV